MAVNYSNHDISTSGLITASSGNFINSLQVNGTGVSLTNHSHSSFPSLTLGGSSVPLNNFLNIDVPSGFSLIEYQDTNVFSINNIEDASLVFAVNGKGKITWGSIDAADVNNFNDTVTSLLPTIANSGNNRVLTSTGSSVGVNGESNLTFDGSLLNVTGSGIFTSGIFASNIGVTGNMIFATNTNGNLIIKPNADGALQADDAGNSRGIFSVDLQRSRISVSGVAHGNYSVIGGGRNNRSAGGQSTIGGGSSNSAGGYQNTIGGGSYNSANGGNYGRATIGGGTSNNADGDYSTVGGGSSNSAGGNYSIVGGGNSNSASGSHSTVGGGDDNTAGALASTIAGGKTNSIYSGSNYSTIAGGLYNNTGNSYSSYYCLYAFVGGGYSNAIYNSYSTIGGGQQNTIGTNNYSDSYSGSCVIGGGSTNFCDGPASTVGGGFSNTAGGYHCTVAGGNNNSASGYEPTVGGGLDNASISNHSTVSGGSSNLASGPGSTIAGGLSNTASGYGSAVVGGIDALASSRGEISHAAGKFADDGDAQHSIFVLRTKTTNNTATEMSLDGASVRLTIDSGQILSGTINIIGSRSDGSAVARYLRQFTIKNVGGTTSLVGSIITLGTDEAAGTSISITADNTNDFLSIKVTGISSQTWRWVTVVDCIKTKYGT